jgi:hypothetical protein
LEWYSLSGQLLHAVPVEGRQAETLTLPAPALPDGAYWLTLREGLRLTARQLIILKK